MLKDTLIKEVQKDIPLIKAALPSRSEVLVIRTLIGIGCICIAVFLIWFFGKNRVDHPLLYWALTFALLFKFFKLLHEWYHYWGIGRLSGKEESVVEKLQQQQAFTVDVMTTACPGEPHEMIKATLLAMKNIWYPHETYLGDEGNDPELREFCLSNGIHHITRDHRTNAKAGNINNILRQSGGDICLVLDPDHTPHPLFLDRVLPHFEDKKVGFVQSVQAYKNQKTSLVAFGAAEQTYHFYGPLMMSMSNYGTAQAIGANCVFRRDALDSIGGHAAGLAEDMHTSMLLHAKGWKSVYVPEILSRGQVPSTLSAFYKQQLKWSRGTLELLFFVLPKIWMDLSWRQRFHYLTLPFYYLAAFIILIDLAIPVISLLVGRTPWLVSLDSFMIFIIPVVCLTILIRQYAQRWLLEHQERGFVLTGGLLKLGAWWVYLLGFFTTILRVKIPYIPTPKEDEPENEFWLNIPNILVAGLCLFAVWYGLSHDFSPYSLVMAAFALVNALVLGINVLISQQKSIEQLKNYLRKRERIHSRSKRMRIYWWKLRHSLYYLIRTRALILLLAVLVFVVLYTRWIERSSLQSIYFNEAAPPEEVLYRGIHLPVMHTQGKAAGLSLNPDTAGFEPAIISFSWQWAEEEGVPADLLKKIYEQGKVPMLNWGPGNGPEQEAFYGQNPFAGIAEGRHDDYLRQMAQQLAQFREPVFIRFAPGFDNSRQSGPAATQVDTVLFRQGWQYVVNLFRREGAYNAIWVYNPGSAEALEAFYPGDRYVDWLGISLEETKNFPALGSRDYLEGLYQPYGDIIAGSFQLCKKPVMLSGLSPVAQEEEAAWLQEVEIFLQVQQQVKSLIYHGPLLDSNAFYGGRRPINEGSQALTARTATAFRTGRQNASQKPEQESEEKGNTFRAARKQLPAGLVGVIYHPVSYWNQSYLPLTRFQLEKDFHTMKALQLNTIYRPITDIYDRNVYQMARKFKLRVIQQLRQESLSFIDRARGYEHLVAWSVGEVSPGREARFWSPDGQEEFLEAVRQLNSLAASIKEKDERPTLVMVDYATLLRAAPLLFQHLSQLDVIAINVFPGEDQEAIVRLWDMHKPSQAYIINIVQREAATYPEAVNSVSDREGASLFRSLQQKSPEATAAYKGFLFRNWMDKNLGRPEGGLVNHRGALKHCYLDNQLPRTEIFLYSNDPEHALKRGKHYQFYAVTEAQSPADSLHFEWYVFDENTGEEEEIEPIAAGGNSIFFRPSANSAYQVVLGVYRNQQLLYNTYLEVKVPL